MICQNCKYSWLTRSELKKVTCPSCSYKVEVKGGFSVNGIQKKKEE